MELKIGHCTLPDPDVVGQSEYRAIWELLESIEDEHGATEVPNAISILKEIQEWCVSLTSTILYANGGERCGRR